jgi:hypothetical protein
MLRVPFLGLLAGVSGGDNPGQFRRVRRITCLIVALEDDHVAGHGRFFAAMLAGGARPSVASPVSR